MKKTNKKNLKKLVPFAAAVFVFAFVTAGCENVMLQKLLRNPNKRLPQPVVEDIAFGVEFENPLAKNLYPYLPDKIPATRSQIYPQAQLIDYVVKVPYGTTSATVTVTSVKNAGENLEFTLSPTDGKMALPSKKPVTITVPEAGKSPKVYSVYFVVCPEAYYVAAYGDDRNSGDSKERPFRQLKTALDAASNSRVVNKVVVVGTLTKANAVGLPVNNTHTFNLENYGLPGFADIGVIDGFSTNNTDVWNKIGSITISGMDGATLKGEGISGGKGVMKITGSYLTFENITFTGGYNAHDSNIGGGGLNITGSEIRLLAGTRVIDNEVIYHINGKNGGGIYAGGSTKLTIAGAEISRNKSGDKAGGIWADGNNTVVNIYSTLISGNTAEQTGNNAEEGRGGGVYINGSATLKATNCIFAGNTATVNKSGGITTRGGGAVCVNASKFEAEGCTFNANTASITGSGNGTNSGGGAVLICGNNSTVIINGGTFTGNTATVTYTGTGNGGGAILYPVSGATVTFQQAPTFTNNSQTVNGTTTATNSATTY